MSALKIDILSKPEEKVDHIAYVIRLAAQSANVPIQLSTTNNFAAFSHCAMNPSQTPVVIINGHVEFSGKAIELEAVKRKLTQIVAQGAGY